MRSPVRRPSTWPSTWPASGENQRRWFSVSLRWAALGALILGAASVLPWRVQLMTALCMILAWVGVHVSRRRLRGALSAVLVAAVLPLAAWPRGESEQAPAATGNDPLTMGLSLGDAASPATPSLPVTAPPVTAPPVTAPPVTAPPVTTPPVKSCDLPPRSSLVLVVETDLPEETVAPFLCGLHAAAVELEAGPLRVQLALFSDQLRLQEAVERLVPGLQFAGSAVERGYWGLVGGEDVIFWNYENTRAINTDPAEVFRVGAHEFYHRFQFALMPPDLRGTAPVWLKEGTAEYFALNMLDAYGFSEHRARYMQWGAGQAATYAADPGTLSNWESQPFAPTMRPYVIYPVVAEIAGMLVERSSEEALLRDFWEEIGSGEPWPEVFRRVFGVPIAEFYGIVDARFG